MKTPMINREIDLSIVVRADNELDRTMRVSALDFAFDSANYIDFTYYGEPNFTYKITNADVISQARLSRISYWTRLTLKLSAQAFKYYVPESFFMLMERSNYLIDLNMNQVR
jgi:hypothetical protein